MPAIFTRTSRYGRGWQVVAALVLMSALLPCLRAEAIPEIESGIEDQSARTKLGSVNLFAYVAGGLGFDNNVLLSHSDRKAALFAFVVPGIRAKRDEDTANHVFLQFDYQARGRRFVGEGNVARASYLEHQFLILGRWKPRAVMEWEFVESAAYLVEPIAADTPRQERFQNELSAKFTYRARTTDFMAKMALVLVRYSQSGFRVLDNDNFQLRLGATYHDLGPRTFLQAHYQMSFYNNRASSRSDFVVHYLMAGISTPVGENKGWVYDFRLGGAFIDVVRNRAATPGAKQMTSLSFELSAKWSQSDPRTFLQALLRNEILPSSALGSTYTNAITLAVNSQYAVNQALVGALNIEQQWIELISNSGDLGRLKVAAVLTYHRQERLAFFGRMEVVNRFAHFKFDRYEDFRLLGGVTYVF